jgi:hypothetical protein
MTTISADERIMRVSKVEHGAPFMRTSSIDDGSDCAEEAEAVEIIVEGGPNTWREAIQSLDERGDSECPPPCDAPET